MMREGQKVCIFREGTAIVGHIDEIGGKQSTITTLDGEKITTHTRRLRTCKV